MTGPEDPAPKFTVIGDWLVSDTGTCTCGSGYYSAHEPYCGLESVAKIADITEWAATRTPADHVNWTPAEYATRSIIGALAALDPAARARVLRDVRDRLTRTAVPEVRHAAPTPAPRREGSGETVCGSEFVGIHGDTTACTYPPGHGPIVGSNGQPWDHGIKGTPAVWRKAAPGGPIPTHLVAGDWTRDDSDDEDDPR